jgi:hypothetical protein
MLVAWQTLLPVQLTSHAKSVGHTTGSCSHESPTVQSMWHTLPTQLVHSSGHMPPGGSSVCVHALPPLSPLLLAPSLLLSPSLASALVVVLLPPSCDPLLVSGASVLPCDPLSPVPSVVPCDVAIVVAVAVLLEPVVAAELDPSALPSIDSCGSPPQPSAIAIDSPALGRCKRMAPW